VKALQASLGARQKCVDDFRTQLFSRLLKPLRSMPGVGGTDVGKASTEEEKEVAVKILQQEMKCRAMQRVVEYQRLFQKTKAYDDAVEQAKRANCFAPVKSSFVRKILEDQPQYKDSWRKRLGADDAISALAKRVLDVVVHEAVGPSLLELDDTAMQLLKADDRKRKLEALEKEEKAGSGSRPFADTIVQLENFAHSKDKNQLPVDLLDESQRELVRDLCHSEYQLTSTEKHKEGGSGKEDGAGAADAVSALVIDRSPEAACIKKHLVTEEEVTDLFANNPDFEAAWEASTLLSDISAQHRECYPAGSRGYWRERGWLASRVPQQELGELFASVRKEQDAMWAARWEELQDLAVCANVFAPTYARDAMGRVQIHDGLRRMRRCSTAWNAATIRDKVMALNTEHKSTIDQAYRLCGKLKTMYPEGSRGKPYVYGSIQDEFGNKIGQAKGELVDFLEVHRMLKQVVRVMDQPSKEKKDKGDGAPIVGSIFGNVYSMSGKPGKDRFPLNFGSCQRAIW